MDLKYLREAIKHYKEARNSIDAFLALYKDELTPSMLATLGNHSCYTVKLIEELQAVTQPQNTEGD